MRPAKKVAIIVTSSLISIFFKIYARGNIKKNWRRYICNE